MVKGRQTRTPAQSLVHTRSNAIGHNNNLFSSPLKKKRKLENENTIDKVRGIGPVTKAGHTIKSPVCITSYFSSSKINGFSENVIKKTDPIKSCITSNEKLLDIGKNIVNNYNDGSPIRDRFETDETPVAVLCRDPPTPHRINMPDSQFIPRNSAEKTEKKTLEVTQFTGQPLAGKTRRGRPKLKFPTLPNQPTNEKANSNACNHKLTEYFPVRRSERKCKKTVLEEKQREIENKVLCQAEDGLEIKKFVEKGRGIVTTRKFPKGEYVVEYIGELIEQVTAKKREIEYAKDQNAGCYMYYFQHRNQQYCVDATAESDKLGRLVNHSRNGNLLARVIDIGSTPHLVLTAKEDIPVGVEITYDYGDRSRESIRNHPWLAL
ncbi:hypothetical protein HCN44_004869 [Aphidius gifuensis]|uniref:[histone H4]-lysine(20) N-methyltransferase n=1 Tax=Aphidius gifuensis TaxID=684658 RepID=A0A835CTN9_APHGI|nr:N-lysine methyltransferase KMT5A [Aphidius gifuensis]KAF7992525.1 hypothetical protein HCN44_004869 [Aphidius gifuensis]